MKITIIGKAHPRGTSKNTGRPFDFLEFHYNGKNRYGSVEGMVGKRFTADPAQVDYGAVQVGCAYDVQFDENGRCIAMAPVAK